MKRIPILVIACLLFYAFWTMASRAVVLAAN